MASIDSLSILITASTASATTKINALTKSLGELRDAINALDVSKFERLATVTGDLSQGFANLKGMGVKEVKAIAKAISTVSEQKGSLDPVAKSAESVVEKTQEIAANTEQVSEGLSRIDSTSIDGLSESMNKVSNTLDKAASKMSGFKSILAKTKIIIPTEGLDKVNKKVEKLQEKIEDLKDRMDFKSRTQADYIDSDEMEKDQEKIAGLINELDRLKLKQQELESHGGFKLNTKSWGFNDFHNALKNANKQINKFISNMFRAKSATRDASKSTESFRLASMKLAKELTRVTKMLKLMVTRMILRKVIQNVIDGFKNLIQYSDGVNASVSMLWNSFRQLGNAVAAAASPLLNALAPVLNYIIQLCIKLVNAINQVLSALLGRSTWTKAKQLSDDYGASLDKTNKSAKDLKRTILGFDELNVLQKNKDSGSGGAGVTAPADMFEEAPIESKWKNLANKLKSILNRLLAPIKTAWEKLGDEVVAAWTGAFKSVKQLLSDIGRDFLTIWNQPRTVQMLETILRIFKDIGGIVKYLADGLDKAWNTNHTGLKILSNIRDIFLDILLHIRNMTFATMMWAKELNFTPLLEAFKNWVISMKPVVDAIAGAFEDFYTKVLLPLGKWTIEKGLPELIQVFIDFNEKVDWKGLREKLADLWEHIEPFAERVGEGLILFIRDCSDAVANFINSKTFQSFLDKIKEWMDTVDAEDVARTLKLVAGAIITLKGALFLLEGIKGLTTLVTTLKTFFALFAAGGSAAEATTVIVDLTGAFEALSGALGTLGASAQFLDFFKHFRTESKINELQEDLTSGKISVEEFNSAVNDARGFTETQTKFQKLKEWLKGVREETGLGKDSMVASEEVMKRYGKTSEELSISIEKDTDSVKNLGQSVKEVDFSKASKEASEFSTNTNKSFAEFAKGAKNMALSVDRDTNKSFANVNLSGKKLSFDLDKTFGDVKKNTNVMTTTVDKDFKTSFGNVEKTTKLMTSTVDSETANLNTSMTGYVKEMTQTVESGAKDSSKAVDDSSNDILRATDKIKDSFSEDKWTFSGVIDGLKKTFGDAIKAIKDKWNSLADALNGKHEIGGGSFNIRLPHFYATGGFPDPEDGWFRASHGEMLGKFDNGQSVVANNTQIIEGIRQGVYDAVSMAMSTSQNNGSIPVQTSIYIGEEQVARAVTRGQRKIDRRYSPTMA